MIPSRNDSEYSPYRLSVFEQVPADGFEKNCGNFSVLTARPIVATILGVGTILFPCYRNGFSSLISMIRLVSYNLQVSIGFNLCVSVIIDILKCEIIVPEVWQDCYGISSLYH